MLLASNVIVFAAGTPGPSVIAALDPVVALGVTGIADLRPLAEELMSRLIRALGSVSSSSSSRG